MKRYDAPDDDIHGARVRKPEQAATEQRHR